MKKHVSHIECVFFLFPVFVNAIIIIYLVVLTLAHVGGALDCTYWMDRSITLYTNCIVHCKNKIVEITNSFVSTVARNNENCI